MPRKATKTKTSTPDPPQTQASLKRKEVDAAEPPPPPKIPRIDAPALLAETNMRRSSPEFKEYQQEMLEIVIRRTKSACEAAAAQGHYDARVDLRYYPGGLAVMLCDYLRVNEPHLWHSIEEIYEDEYEADDEHIIDYDNRLVVTVGWSNDGQSSSCRSSH